jgi:hypothetical protein
MIEGAKVRNLAKPITENIKITGSPQFISSAFEESILM